MRQLTVPNPVLWLVACIASQLRMREWPPNECLFPAGEALRSHPCSCNCLPQTSTVIRLPMSAAPRCHVNK